MHRVCVRIEIRTHVDPPFLAFFARISRQSLRDRQADAHMEAALRAWFTSVPAQSTSIEPRAPARAAPATTRDVWPLASSALYRGSATAAPFALFPEGLARLAMQTLRIGLLRAGLRNCRPVRIDGRLAGGRSAFGVGAGARAGRRTIDADAGAYRNLRGRLGQRSSAGKQGQQAGSRKDSTGFHFNAPSLNGIRRLARDVTASEAPV
jgi:hypothetical protein